MTDQYHFDDGETVTLARGMSDESRLRLIAKAIAMEWALREFGEP